MAAPTISQTNEKKAINYFKKQMAYLKFFGISFTGDESIAYKLYSVLLLASTVFAYVFLDGYELFKHDFDTSSDVLMYESMIIVSSIKVWIVMANRIKFGEVMAKLGQAPFLPDPNRGGDEEKRLIQECIWKTNAQTVAYWIALYVSAPSSFLYGLYTRIRNEDYHKWQMGYGPFTVLDVTHSPNYEISLVYQCVCVFVAGSCFATIDLLISAVLAHVSYQFKILQNFLRIITTHSYREMLKDTTNNVQSSSLEMATVDDEIDPSAIPWKYSQKSIKQAVCYHIAIFDIAKEIEETFCYVLLSMFLISLSCLCFELYYASSQTSALGFLRNVVEVFLCVFQVLTYCYWGEQVIIESQQVGIAAYESNFVGSDVRFQKALALIIRRSQNPTKITAGKFSDACLTTFAWFMRASYSIFMVIRNTKQEKYE